MASLAIPTVTTIEQIYGLEGQLAIPCTGLWWSENSLISMSSLIVQGLLKQRIVTRS
jgi:hypothetical protein